jgi:hypothetical protein
MQGTAAASLIFGSSVITGHPQVLALRLRMSLVKTGSPKVPSASTQKSIQDAGTVEFSFTLPFHVGREVDPQERVTSQGQTITLERVVVGQFETQVVVQGIEQAKSKFPLEVALSPPGDETPGFMPAHAEANNFGTSTFIYPYDFFQKQGTWILSIQQGTNSWLFYFVVPATS